MTTDERAPEARDALRGKALHRLIQIADPGSALHPEDECPVYLLPAEARTLLSLLSERPDADDETEASEAECFGAMMDALEDVLEGDTGYAESPVELIYRLAGRAWDAIPDAPGGEREPETHFCGACAWRGHYDGFDHLIPGTYRLCHYTPYPISQR